MSFRKLYNNLDIGRQRPDFNENDYIQQYYKDNKKQIQDSIDIITDLKGKKYLFVKTINLRRLIELKNFYENKLTEFNFYLDYVNEKINKYDY